MIVANDFLVASNNEPGEAWENKLAGAWGSQRQNLEGLGQEMGTLQLQS